MENTPPTPSLDSEESDGVGYCLTGSLSGYHDAREGSS